MSKGLFEVLSEQIQVNRSQTTASRRSRKHIRIKWTWSIAWLQIQTRDVDCDHLNAILRVSRTCDNGGCSAIVDSIPSADDCLWIKSITDTKPRTEIVLVTGPEARVETGGSQTSIWIFDRRLSDRLVIVSQTKI